MSAESVWSSLGQIEKRRTVRLGVGLIYTVNKRISVPPTHTHM